MVWYCILYCIVVKRISHCKSRTRVMLSTGSGLGCKRSNRATFWGLPPSPIDPFSRLIKAHVEDRLPTVKNGKRIADRRLTDAWAKPITLRSEIRRKAKPTYTPDATLLAEHFSRTAITKQFEGSIANVIRNISLAFITRAIA